VGENLEALFVANHQDKTLLVVHKFEDVQLTET
jgi:hypothetical protein